MSKLRKCDIPECKTKNSRKFALPSDKRLRDIWIQRINPEFMEYNLTNFHVCEAHFSNMCIKSNGRLLRFSVPTINLPNYHELSTPATCFCPPKYKAVLKLPNTCKPVLASSETLSVKIPQKVYLAPKIKKMKTSMMATTLENSPSAHLKEESVSCSSSIESVSSISLINQPENAQAKLNCTVNVPPDEINPDVVEDCKPLDNLSLLDIKPSDICDLSESHGCFAVDLQNGRDHSIHSNASQPSDNIKSEVADEDESDDDFVVEVAGLFPRNDQECSSNLNGKASTTEKPYFKSIKSYLPGSNTLAEMCRICFRPLVNEEEMVRLYEEPSMVDTAHIKTMLQFVLPDIDLQMYSKTVICTRCTKSLQLCYNFKETWLPTEKKLQRIVEKKKPVINRFASLIIHEKESKKGISQQNDISVNDSTSCNEEVSKKSEESSCRPSKPYMCEKCGRRYTYLKTLKRHFKCHAFAQTKQKRKEGKMCEVCGKLFLNAEALRRHRRVHMTPKCLKCDRTFNNNAALYRHTHYVHVRRFFQCHLCGKQFVYPSSFRLHMKIHDPQTKVHDCGICGKKFFLPCLLKKHLRTHGTDNLWTCKFCGRSVKYEKTLQRHIRTYHLNAGDVVCKFCSKPYWKTVDLKRHLIRVHGRTLVTPELRKKSENKTVPTGDAEITAV